MQKISTKVCLTRWGSYVSTLLRVVNMPKGCQIIQLIHLFGTRVRRCGFWDQSFGVLRGAWVLLVVRIHIPVHPGVIPSRLCEPIPVFM